MAGEVFNLGDILSTANRIKAERSELALEPLRRKYLETQIGNLSQSAEIAKTQESRAAAEFENSQQVQNTKLLNAAAAEIMQNPMSIDRWLPQLHKAGVIDPAFNVSNLSPDIIQQGAQSLFESTSAALQALAGPNRESEPLESVVGSDGKPVLVPRSRAAGATPYYQPRSSRGLRVQSDGAGGFSLYEGDGAAGIDLGTPAKNQLQKGAIDAQSGLDRLSGIRQGFDPKWLTYGEQAKQFAMSVKAKAQGLPFVSKLSPQEQSDLSAFSRFKSDTLDNLNRYITEITGAAMGVEEAKRIVSTMPSMNDDPVSFQTKMGRVEQRLKLVLARSVYTQKNGIKFDAVPVEEIERIMNRRGDEIFKQTRDKAATLEALEAEFFR